ncbi:phosphoribosyltransferase [Streptomyces sp. NPDC058471]|uniref:phosphoribosyltransferase n=1 Tax=Streptomyces sp. NPDC058471 TaxID=3346516 RepID=UPI00364E3130
MTPPPAQRTFEAQRIWQLSQHEFPAAACLIAAGERVHRPDVVIGIARGGVRLAEIISEQLGVPTATISVRHNTSDSPQQAATGHLDFGPVQDMLMAVAPGGRVLLVDDICGSGVTLGAVTKLLHDQARPTCVRTAVLCRNRSADYPVNTWGWDVADWVWFPWEERPDTHVPVEPLPALSQLRHCESEIPRLASYRR